MPVRIRHLALARTPGIVRRRVAETRAARLQLIVEFVYVARRDPHPGARLALVSLGKHDRHAIAPNGRQRVTSPLEPESEPLDVVGDTHVEILDPEDRNRGAEVDAGWLLSRFDWLGISCLQWVLGRVWSDGHDATDLRGRAVIRVRDGRKELVTDLGEVVSAEVLQ